MWDEVIVVRLWVPSPIGACALGIERLIEAGHRCPWNGSLDRVLGCLGCTVVAFSKKSGVPNIRPAQTPLDVLLKWTQLERIAGFDAHHRLPRSSMKTWSIDTTRFQQRSLWNRRYLLLVYWCLLMFTVLGFLSQPWQACAWTMSWCPRLWSLSRRGCSKLVIQYMHDFHQIYPYNFYICIYIYMYIYICTYIYIHPMYY